MLILDDREVVKVAILFEASPGFGAGRQSDDHIPFPWVAILFEASPGFGGRRKRVCDVHLGRSQSSLKRVLVSERPGGRQRGSLLPQVAILFEASPGFGDAMTVTEGLKNFTVAILFEASPGFGV